MILKIVNPSKILYLFSVVLLIAGFLIGSCHFIQRKIITNAKCIQDLFIWDILSQWSVFLIVLAICHFVIAIKIDRLMIKNNVN